MLFSPRGMSQSFVPVRNIRQPFSTTSEGHFNQGNHQRKDKNAKNTALTRAKDAHLQYES